MKKHLLVFLILIGACNQPDVTGKPNENAIVVISNDTIPETRTIVKKLPVAEFQVHIPDELNKWRFAVSAFETPKTFQFVLHMHYKEISVADTLKIPNFGIQPTVVIHKDNVPLSCIIGFLDKKGQFRAYKKAFVLNEQMKLVTLNSYYTGIYRTKLKTPS